MKERFTFELSEPVTYAQDGQQLEALEIEIVAPSKKLYQKTYLLQQIVTQSLLKAQELMPSGEDSKQDDKEATGKDIKMVLLAGGADIKACIDQVYKLGNDGCILIAGNKINFIQWGKIDQLDQEKIACEFIANFTFPLVMNSLTS